MTQFIKTLVRDILLGTAFYLYFVKGIEGVGNIIRVFSAVILPISFLFSLTAIEQPEKFVNIKGWNTLPTKGTQLYNWITDLAIVGILAYQSWFFTAAAFFITMIFWKGANIAVIAKKQALEKENKDITNN